MTRADEDEWVRLRAAESVAMLGDPAGIPALIQIARSGDARVARQSALKTLLSLSGLDHGKPREPTDAEAPALMRTLERWWQQHHGDLQWDAARRSYRPEP